MKKLIVSMVIAIMVVSMFVFAGDPPDPKVIKPIIDPIVIQGDPPDPK